MKYDLIVIGGGPGGYVAAIRAAQLGIKTALIEDRDLGGTCLNRGCIPTKTLMHSAGMYHEASAFETIGICTSGLSFDFDRMHLHKNTVVDTLRDGVENLLKANHVDVIKGHGILHLNGVVEVEHSLYEGSSIIIATGSVPSRLPIPGSDLPGVVTSDDLLENSGKFFNSLFIIGGGVIGIEMACIYSSLGTKVTIVEALGRLLPMMDRDISQNITMILKKAGVEIHTSASVTGITKTDNELLSCTFRQNEDVTEREAETILMSTGRRANIKNLFAEGATPETERGRIIVDCRFRTSIPGVYAIGDVTGGMQLAHAAEAQGIACAEYINGAAFPSVDPLLVPSCVYTTPEIACVGVTAEEAKNAGRNIKIGKYIMNGNAKTLIDNQPRSFIKLIFEEETEKLIGAQIMCARATDMISEMTTAISADLTKDDLLRALRPHPTFCEAITEAAELADGHSIHAMPSRVSR